MRKNLLLLLLACIAFTFNIQAQSGKSDVRFVQEPRLNCDPDPVTFIIEVRASSADTEFFMSEQNYRFSFNDDAISNPRIVEELEISGAIIPPPVPRTDLGYTAFAKHNLVGSLDTVVSYNVELSGGDGYYLFGSEWVQVGRIQFDVDQFNSECYELKWHPLAVFPPTFVGEVFTENDEDARANTTENLYINAFGCLCVFPVELTSFEGEERDCQNHLTWETATETNSAYFAVERSLDATQFTEIGRVNSAGNSLESITYNFTDEWAEAAAYYRLKQVDIDGTYEYFDIIKIDSDCYADNSNRLMDVFPNPTVGEKEAFIKLLADKNETAYIDIINMMGKQIAEIPVEISEGSNVLDFPTDNLAAGTYFIRVRGESWFSSASKFVKINDN